MFSFKPFFTALIGTLFTLALSAQEHPGHITGRVLDDNKKPLESVSLTLLQVKDSAKIRTVVSDRTGHYSFTDLNTGQYRVMATSVGLSIGWSPVVEVSSTQPLQNLQPLLLHPTAGSLQAIAVVGKKPFIEQKTDRMVVNVEASPASAGATALDMLEKSPGVTLDKDDNISLKGKQGVTIMIDDKPTYMSSDQLANYLKGLPASAIDQIEIMTNPPAKYDAAGNAGIINIKTKKNKMKGFNGSLALTHTQGIYPKPSGSLNLNYRTGKFNFFLNGGYSHWEGFQTMDIGRTYLDPGPSKTINSIFSQETDMHFTNPEANIKLGMDYYLDNKTTIGFVVRGFQNKEIDKNRSTIYLKDPQSVVDSIVYSPSTNTNSWKNGSVNLNFRHQYDSLGTELTADLDYVRYASVGDQYFDNRTYNPDWTLRDENVLTGHNPSTINIYTFKSDYTHPFTKSLKLEAGLKSSYVNTDNMAGYFNVINNTPEMDTTKTNHFLYRENINAAYLSLNRQWKKWGVQAGLRLENTNYSGHQLGNDETVIREDSSFSRSYFSLFPTVYLTYQLNDKNQFVLNYGRRIDRPAYQDLNPFLFFLDQYTYQAGNPYLQPQFSHNVELSHTYGGFLTTTANYSYTRNFMAETFEQSGHATIVRKGNIGTRQNAGLAISAQVPLAKWWTAIFYGNVNYTAFSGTLYGESVHIDATTLTLNLNNQFNFAKGWSGELSGFYRTKGIEGQIVIDPMGQGTIAVSKKLLKDKAALKLAVRDFLYTNKITGYINFQQTEATFRNVRDSRQLSITFTYRFGKPLKAPNHHRGEGAEDEENRVNAGGNRN